MQHADGVLERLAREDVGRLDAGVGELDDLPPGRFGEVVPSRVDRRDRGAAGQRQSQRLGDAGHRRRGAHRHAVAVRTGHRVLDLDPVGLRDPAGSELLVVVPAVAARPDLASAPAAVQHRSTGHHDRWDVRAGRAHDARGIRLVAPGEKDDAVERVRPDRLLHVHRHQVPVQHRCGLHERLAEGQDRELERESRRPAGRRASPIPRAPGGARCS